MKDELEPKNEASHFLSRKKERPCWVTRIMAFPFGKKGSQEQRIWLFGGRHHQIIRSFLAIRNSGSSIHQSINHIAHANAHAHFIMHRHRSFDSYHIGPYSLQP